MKGDLTLLSMDPLKASWGLVIFLPARSLTSKQFGYLNNVRHPLVCFYSATFQVVPVSYKVLSYK